MQIVKKLPIFLEYVHRSCKALRIFIGIYACLLRGKVVFFHAHLMPFHKEISFGGGFSHGNREISYYTLRFKFFINSIVSDEVCIMYPLVVSMEKLSQFSRFNFPMDRGQRLPPFNLIQMRAFLSDNFSKPSWLTRRAVIFARVPRNKFECFVF